MKIDFMQTVDIIFGNRRSKSDWKKLTNEDKETNFFIINRKFAVKYLKQAQFFNSKSIDKSSAMDIWYLFFRNTKGTPYWYWAKSNAPKKEKRKISGSDSLLLMDRFDFDDNDFEFLYKYHLEDLQHELKKIKRFEN